MPESKNRKFQDAILDLFASKCKDTTQLLSESMDHDISVFKHFKIRFHLMLCEFCCHYKEQLQTLRGMAKGLQKKDDPDLGDDSQLNSTAKERMKKLLEEDKK